jgi:hypothetical protein
LKHRLFLEAVSSLSQQALIIDVAAKFLADHIAALMRNAAAEHTDVTARQRKCDRSYAASLLQRLLPRRILLIGDARAAIADAITLLAHTSQRFVAGPSHPRHARHVKPPSSCAYKGVSAAQVRWIGRGPTA